MKDVWQRYLYQDIKFILKKTAAMGKEVNHFLNHHEILQV